MRDVEDGDAGLGGPADQIEEIVGFHIVQCGGGFVQDQNPRIGGEHLRDFDQLLLGYGAGADLNAGIQLQADLLQDAAGFGVHGLVVHEAVLFGQLAHEDVFRDGNGGDVVQFLMDYADARVPGLKGKVEVHGLSIHANLAGVRLIDAGQHLDEGGLARAVFTQ